MGLSTTMFRLMMKGHVWTYRTTGGRLGSMKGQILLLTTTGRRTGIERTLPLMGIEHGAGYLVAASAGGSPTHPAWYLNLTANPNVLVQRGKEVRERRARTATADERPPLWIRFADSSQQFSKYEAKTDRKIPVVIIEPREG